MKGFTLIELLVVIGIMVILMAAALVAINPFRQFAMANNAARWSGVTTIMDAVSQAIVDGKGSFKCSSAATTDCPAKGDNVPLSSGPKNMADPTSDPAGYDICSCLVDKYVAAMPYDPQKGSYTACGTYNADYKISCNATNGRITISASDVQLGEIISITR